VAGDRRLDDDRIALINLPIFSGFGTDIVYATNHFVAENLRRGLVRPMVPLDIVVRIAAANTTQLDFQVRIGGRRLGHIEMTHLDLPFVVTTAVRDCSAIDNSIQNDWDAMNPG